MKAVGEMLREERKRQGMSIDDVMSRTKVSRRHIEALEDGNIMDLPHPVYLKGFLKVYAELLGLEYKKLLPAVDDAYANLGLDPSETEPHARPSENISLSPPPRSGMIIRIFVILFILALLGSAGYFGYQYFFVAKDAPIGAVTNEKQESVASAQAPSDNEAEVSVVQENIADVDEPVAESPAAAANDTISDSLLVTESVSDSTPEDRPAPSTVQDQNAPAETDEETVVSELAEAVVQGSEPPAQETASEPPSDPASPNIVIIPETARQAPRSKIKVLQVIAKGQCWIEAKVDAELTTDFYVRKGERVDIKFQENLAVKFGNIGEVTLRYNGKLYTTAVPANGVKTLVFPPPGS